MDGCMDWYINNIVQRQESTYIWSYQACWPIVLAALCRLELIDVHVDRWLDG